MLYSSSPQTLCDRGPVKLFFYEMRASPNKCQGPAQGRGPAVVKYWSVTSTSMMVD
jgi:hypothetical protein